MNYALANAWDNARRRLGLLERYLDPITRQRLSELGIRPGWHCLDVGAGTGSVARWLCRQVGSAGRVLATDIDIRFLREIRAGNFEAREHDIQTDELPPAQFDLICVRWLLHHLRDPEHAIHTMIKALRPGGWLLVEEVDFFPVLASGSQTYADFMRALVSTVVSAGGGNGWWARGLPELIAKQGLADIGAAADLPILRGGSPLAEFFHLTAAQMRGRVIDAGFLSAERFDAGAALLQDPGFWGFAGAGIGVWGRVPPQLRSRAARPRPPRSPRSQRGS